MGIAITLLIVSYVALRRSLHLPEYADILAAIAGFAGLVLTGYQIIRDVRRKDSE
jgi:hypothetical protein